MSEPGTRPLVGTRIGPYQVRSFLGAGGMGEVYRARDTKLGRDVAIKVVADRFTADPARVARLEREARVLASLNHPSIGAIYGLEEADGVSALVLELIEGPTLADRLAGGPLAIPETVAIARQIADALDVAHEKGIVHRDLKPSNIKVATDGAVKVLDFGLATVLAGDQSDVSQAPTMTFVGTGEGVIAGTPAYMSPEQARGATIDKRTDIWAFGCVLYEMVTGHAAFAGPSVPDVFAGILEREPDWTRLPSALPPPLRALIERCLQKDPKRRLRDIGDARIDFDDQTRTTDVVTARSRRTPLFAAAVAAGIAVGALGVWWLGRARSTAPEIVPARLAFSAPDEAPDLQWIPASSPDGRQIAYTATNAAGEAAVWIRSLDSPTSRRIAGTDGSRNPFWSPDGRFVAFGVPAEGRLKKIDLVTGDVQNLATIRDMLGATWSRDGVILYAPDSRVPLYRVSASGGTSEPVTRLDPERRENSHRWPHFLPDGRHFLYTARSDVRENTGIYVGTLGSNERTWLLEAQSGAAYADGYLLFVRDGTLLAQRFDPESLRLAGEPIGLTSNVAQATAGAMSMFSTSTDGRVVVYQRAAGQNTEIVWFDRKGAKVGATIAEGTFQQLRLSPDGTRAAVVVTDRDTGNRDIWHVNLGNGALTRFTSHPANDWVPVWSPDSSDMIFASDRDGVSWIFRQPSDGSRPEVAIARRAVKGHVFPSDWSSDGRMLGFETSLPETGLDAWVMPIEQGEPQALSRTTFQEHSVKFSPDGRWIAYVSDESGVPEVYVRGLSDAARIRVSTSGGVAPRWRRDGRELFFVDGQSRLTSVAINGAASLVVSPPVPLFKACRPLNQDMHSAYEVAPLGEQSLWLCPSRRQTADLVHVSIGALPRRNGD